MRWIRITKLAAVLAMLTTAAIGALPVSDWVGAELRARAERPDPVLATPEETRAILGAVLRKMEFGGVPPPPPEPGEPSRPEPKRVLILADQTLCFAEIPTRDCASDPGVLLVPELDKLAPRKLRAELLAANRTLRQLDISGIPDTRVVSARQLQQMFQDGWWDDFYRTYPGTAGFASISQPVLTSDRQQALIYVAHRCDGLCGSGTVHLLVRSGSSWRIVREEMLWVS